MTPLPSLTTLLKRLRSERGLTQEELAAASGVSARSISDIERGLNRAPYRDTIALLADALALKEDERTQLLDAARSGPLVETEKDDTTLAHLPRLQTSTIGRDVEIAQVVNLLALKHCRMVTITGPAGVGKTRLAIVAARAASSHYREGIAFVDLTRIRSAERVPAAIAMELQVRQHGGQTLLDALVTVLTTKHMLLVLDNFEHALAAAPDIATLLARCPNTALLITSRASLKLPEETLYTIAPLALPDIRQLPTYDLVAGYPAVALFVDRARAVRADFSILAANARTIAQICSHLDGIPLAIELTAATIGTISPQSMLLQLAVTGKTTKRWMTGSLRSAAPRRQQTMRDTIAWGYSLLDSAAQIVFRRFAVFHGGASLEAIETVCSGNSDDTETTITAISVLLDHHLMSQETIAHDQIRCTLLETVREFGLEMLAARKEETAIGRKHAAYYAQFAIAQEMSLTGPHQVQAMVDFTLEYDNIRAALRWARAQREIDLGMNLAVGCQRFWEKRGMLSEGREWMDGLLDLWRTSVNPERSNLVARIMQGSAVLASIQGDFSHAQQQALECLALNQELNNTNGIARVNMTLGNIAKLSGDFPQAAQYFRDNVEQFRELGDSESLLMAMNNLSAIYLEVGDVVKALPILRECLSIKRDRGDQRGLAVSLINMSEALKQQGDFVPAQESLHEALDLFSALRDQQGIGMALNNLGEIELVQQRYAEARELFERGLAAMEAIESRNHIALLVYNLGLAELGMEDGRSAAGPLPAEHIQEAYRFFRAGLLQNIEIQNRSGILRCLLGLAKAAHKLGLTSFTVTLIAAADARRDEIALTLTEEQQLQRATLIECARNLLTVSQFDESYAAGQRLSDDDLRMI